MLSRKLIVYSYCPVKSSLAIKNEENKQENNIEYGKIERIEFLDNTPLNLAQNFEQLWHNLWPNYIQNSDKLYFLQSEIDGNSAGFTDSRIIHIWLQNLMLFYSTKQVFFAKTHLLELNLENTEQALQTSNPMKTDLEYSSEPRIG